MTTHLAKLIIKIKFPGPKTLEDMDISFVQSQLQTAEHKVEHLTEVSLGGEAVKWKLKFKYNWTRYIIETMFKIENYLPLYHGNCFQLLNESEATVLRLTEQAKVLKEEIRRQERNQERETAVSNMEYLKNIVFKVCQCLKKCLLFIVL